MISRIDHIAIAVRITTGHTGFFPLSSAPFPAQAAGTTGMKYFWQNLSLGDLSRLELLTATGPGSFLDGFLAKKEGGVHHITMQTPDIKKAAATLESSGIPYFGYHEYGDFWKELFIHPKNAFGVLIQIAEFNADDWLAADVRMPGGKKYTIRRGDGGFTLSFPHPGGGTVTISMNGDELKEFYKEIGGMIG